MSAGKRRRREGMVTAPSLEDIGVPESIRRRLDNHGVVIESLEGEGGSATESVVQSLRRHGITDETVLRSFHDNGIEVRHLASLSKSDLADMGIRAVGSQKDVLSAINEITSQTREEEKVFNDPVHGHIELHPLMVKVMDTPQFQRLRYIKQLGGGYYVFPGASHNRFEHSIGVGYLAGELVEMLKRKQPELEITDQDVLCVKLAGLCHDLGHGPFSHLFDGRFIPRVLPNTDWKHEDASVMMFDHLINENGLEEEMEKYGLGTEDIIFIKELITGAKNSYTASSQNKEEWPYEGRPESKSFLYEIVANKRTGVDVDKWDYFARDCHYLGVPNNFDMRRFMKFARVIEVKGRRQICTRDKEVTNLYEMFHTRSTLHRRAYQHKTSNIIELMITEAFVAANDHLLIQGRERLLKMSEAIEDPVAYAKLTDQILQRIQHSTEAELKPSREILARFERRKLYKLIGQAQVTPGLTKKHRDEIHSEIISCLSASELDGLPVLCANDIAVLIATFDYGMGKDNPIDQMRFYVKNDPYHAEPVHKDQVSQMLPHTFKEQQVRVFCKREDKPSREAARKYFERWCNIPHEPYKIISVDYMDGTAGKSIYLTPRKQEPESVPGSQAPKIDIGAVREIKF